jgi:hypothetical protein
MTNQTRTNVPGTTRLHVTEDGAITVRATVTQGPIHASGEVVLRSADRVLIGSQLSRSYMVDMSDLAQAVSRARNEAMEKLNRKTKL